MAYNLLDVLASGNELRWIIARVRRHDAARRRLEIVIGDPADASIPSIPNVMYLSSYTPRVGDVVHVLAHEKRGMLVLGTTSP